MIRRHKTDKKYQPDLLATSWHFGFFLLFIAFTVQAADVLDDLKRLDTDIENRRSKATEITKANEIPIELQKMRATLRTDLGAASGRLAAYDKKLNEEKLNLHQAAERRLVRDNRIDDAKIVRGQIQLLGLAPDPVALAGGPAAPAAAQGFRPVRPPVGGHSPVPDMVEWTFDASNNPQSFEKVVQNIGIGCYQSQGSITPDMWISVTFPKPVTVDTATLDCGRYNDDFPESYTVNGQWVADSDWDPTQGGTGEWAPTEVNEPVTQGLLGYALPRIFLHVDFCESSVCHLCCTK